MKKENPIGIFDSGMGGLTVLKEVANKLNNENIIYFGDTAHLPYGNKSRNTVSKYSYAIAEFLKLKNIKLMVVACNTASVFALESLREKFNIPIIGVVDSGVNAAVREAKNSVGIIGTYATVKSKVYENKIRKINSKIQIYSRSCPLFVPLVEEGWLDHPVTKRVAEIYLNNLKEKIDSIILACTHYPMIKNVISETLGREIAIIDSAVEVAKEVKNKVSEMKMENKTNKKQEIKYFVSDSPELFKKEGTIFMGKRIENVSLVEID
ncbi:MAG: glutamate racemase [Elusimicrobiota bacterium]